VSRQFANPTSEPSDALELSIVIPCLNEAESLAVCLRKARRFLETNGVRCEVLVAVKRRLGSHRAHQNCDQLAGTL
jgi:hypothetical protein